VSRQNQVNRIIGVGDEEANYVIPLGDDDSLRRLTPLVTYALIATNVLVFWIELRRRDAFIFKWAFIPARFKANPSGQFITIFTSMFMHASWLHLGGNMLFLWVFGDNVEDRFGHTTFLIFYLLCGAAATFAQMAFSIGARVPNLGASGAIAGVLGAYLMLFPNEPVKMLAITGVLRISALIVIGLWFVLQLFNEIASISSSPTTSRRVAYVAHIGGFLAGLLMTYALLSNWVPRIT
jgi:rhomboid family protein